MGVAGAAPSPFEAAIVEVFADLVVLLGLPKSLGEIYGFIFASAEPATFADIEQKLGLSKGSVSQGLRALKALGAIREAGDFAAGAGKISSEGKAAKSAGKTAESARRSGESGRATHWVATTELRQLLGSLLRERLTPYLERQDQRMEQAEAALAAEASRLSEQDFKALKNRLSKLQTWQSRARTVLPVIGKML